MRSRQHTKITREGAAVSLSNSLTILRMTFVKTISIYTLFSFAYIISIQNVAIDQNSQKSILIASQVFCETGTTKPK